MPVKRALKLIGIAKEEETKEYHYRWWLVRYPHYTEENYESFDEFYENAKPKKIEVDERSEEEIMREILEIENLCRKGEENGTV